MMRVVPVATNHTELISGDLTVFCSYSTPVAYYDQSIDVVYKTTEKFSATTTRHLKKWLESFYGTSVVDISQENLDSVVSKITS